MKLMVVESPNKIKKLQAELGDGWKILASAGHVRDLPREGLGIEGSDFKLNYEYIPPVKVEGRTFPGGRDRVERIRSELGKAQMVFLATDPDREGEAIAWHLKDALGLSESQYQRITFDEVTGKVVRAALEKPRKIDNDLVQAQEARRALDRIVGYVVSPLLSDLLGQNLSAGRVQSVAVRLVVDRETKIRGFRKTSHFGAEASFDGGSWKANWNTKPFVSEESPYVQDEELAKSAASARQFRVISSSTDTAREAPPSPFSTSLLLQAASVSLKLDPEVTAKLAQRLFEQGAITYIRTDSVNFGEEAISEIRGFATGKGWKVPDKARRFKTKGDAQEAHEAIRPTHIDVEDAGEDDQQRALYRLIWQRSMASQLADALYTVNAVTLESTDTPKPFEFKAKGRALIDAGWRVLTAKDAVEDIDAKDDAENADTGKVPTLVQDSDKQADEGRVVAKQTMPPKRFTKASLIAKLEVEGIGRPATYPAIMNNVMARGYLSEDKRYLMPTETGELVVNTLVKAGFGFMELDFTRDLESELDEIAEGRATYLSVVAPAFDQINREMASIARDGDFKPRFPCPKCEAGLRRYKRRDGSGHLWACPDQECKTFLDDIDGKPMEPKVHSCPKCSADLRRYQKKDKETGKPKGFGWFCTNQECKTFMDDDKGKPVAIKTAPCPKCSKPMFRRKSTQGTGYWWGCSGFKDGCKTIMDDKNGKPIPKGQTSSTKKPSSGKVKLKI